MSHLAPYHPHHHGDANEFVKIHNGVHIDSPYHHPHHGHHGHHHGHPHQGGPVSAPQHGLAADPQHGLLDILGGLFSDVQYPGAGAGGPQHDLAMDPQHGLFSILGKVIGQVAKGAMSDVQYPGAGGPQHDLSMDPQHGLLGILGKVIGQVAQGAFSDVQYPGAGGPQHDLAADPQHGLLDILGGLFSDVQYPGGSAVGPQNFLSVTSPGIVSPGIYGSRYKLPPGVVADVQYPGAGGPQHGLLDIFKGIFSDVQVPGAGGPQHGLSSPGNLDEPQHFIQFIGPAISILGSLLGKQHGLDPHGIAEKAKKDDKVSSLIKETQDVDKKLSDKRNELVKLAREKKLLYASLQTRVLHAHLDAASKKEASGGTGDENEDHDEE